jgi:hypothetical protein
LVVVVVVVAAVVVVVGSEIDGIDTDSAPPDNGWKPHSRHGVTACVVRLIGLHPRPSPSLSITPPPPPTHSPTHHHKHYHTRMYLS